MTASFSGQAIRRAILPLYVGRRPLPRVAVIAGYFDDSQAGDGRGGIIYVIGGYLGTVEMWDEVFAPAWNAVLASAPHPITEFKASDCRHKRAQCPLRAYRRGWWAPC